MLSGTAGIRRIREQPTMRAALSLAAFAIIAMTGTVDARSPADCEAIRDWHAYNTCLASFGTQRGQRAARAAQGGNPEARVYRGRRVESAPRRRVTPGLNVQRVAGGRVRATLDISAPRRR
jgi:hypothetical protein